MAKKNFATIEITVAWWGESEATAKEELEEIVQTLQVALATRTDDAEIQAREEK